jgi:hypothetical protein
VELQRSQTAAFHGQAAVQSNLLGGATQKSHGRLLHQPFSGGVDQTESLIRVECEQGYINLFDYTAQQRSGFDGSNALFG